MLIFKQITDIEKFLSEWRQTGSAIKDNIRTTGFVPTMGALHEGHLSLIRKSKLESALTVCSIFVNPIQFNNKDDLNNYPREIEADIEKLETVNCDVLFAPSVEEMYPEMSDTKSEIKYDFGYLDQIMEGRYRQGHFNGVAVVLERLFDIIKPQNAYFGYKDFQQLAVVKELVKKLNLPIRIVGCPTVREKDGLAMSSRNKLLSVEERKSASVIPSVLFQIEKLKNQMSVKELKHWIKRKINNTPLLKLVYFEIVDFETLKPIENWDTERKTISCIAVYAGKIRLIDNIIIQPNPSTTGGEVNNLSVGDYSLRSE